MIPARFISSYVKNNRLSERPCNSARYSCLKCIEVIIPTVDTFGSFYPWVIITSDKLYLAKLINDLENLKHIRATLLPNGMEWVFLTSRVQNLLHFCHLKNIPFLLYLLLLLYQHQKCLLAYLLYIRIIFSLLTLILVLEKLKLHIDVWPDISTMMIGSKKTFTLEEGS